MADPCIYIRIDGKDVSFLAIYIDDCMVFTLEHLVSHIKKILHDSFKMTNLREASLILSLEVLHNCTSRSICLHQTGKIQEILHDFTHKNAKPIGTLMEPSLSTPQAQENYRQGHHHSIPFSHGASQLPGPCLKTQHHIHHQHAQPASERLQEESLDSSQASPSLFMQNKGSGYSVQPTSTT